MVSNAPSRSPRVLLVLKDASGTDGFAGLRQATDLEVVVTDEEAVAVTHLEHARFDVVVAEAELVGEGSGLSLLARAREVEPSTVRMLIAEPGAFDLAVRAVNDVGVFRILERTATVEALHEAVRAAAALRHKIRRFPTGRMASVHDREIAWEALDRALAELWLAHQPIVDARCRRPVGFELLARSDAGLATPNVLFRTARKLGRLPELERRVRALAAESVASLPEGVRAWVNVEPESLSDPALVEPLAPLSRVADRVVLELTEHTKVLAIPDLASIIERLRALGFHIAIDDLGQGHAGLSALARLEPDIVKLDHELVAGIHTAPVLARFVRSLLEACGELGIRTVAEGLEDAQDLQVMLELGCDWCQGYLLGRPERQAVVPRAPLLRRLVPTGSFPG